MCLALGYVATLTVVAIVVLSATTQISISRLRRFECELARGSQGHRRGTQRDNLLQFNQGRHQHRAFQSQCQALALVAQF